MKNKFILVSLTCFINYSVISQNIGIGTNTPAFKLDVQGRTRIKAGTLNNVNTSAGIWMDDYRNGNNQFFFGMKDSIRAGFYGSGAGIGWNLLFNTRTGNFNDNFNLNGTVNLYSGTTDYSGGSLYSDSNDIYITARKAAPANTKGNLILQFADPRNPNLLSGNVGIDVDTPLYKLAIKGNIGLYNGTGVYGTLQNNSNDLLVNARIGNSILGTSAQDIILQYENDLFTNSGKVGIGTDAPTEKLDVNGNIKVDNKIIRSGSGTTNMIPIAYGRLNEDGSVANGSGNFSVAHSFTGQYYITISGETLSATNTVAIATLVRSNSNVNRVICIKTNSSPSGGYYFFFTADTVSYNYDQSTGITYVNGIFPEAIDAAFSFVIYKQ